MLLALPNPSVLLNGFATWFYPSFPKAWNKLSVVSSLCEMLSLHLRVNHGVIYCFTCVIYTNPQDFILSIKCREGVFYSAYRQYAVALGLTDKTHSYSVFASVHATMFHSLLRKVSHIVSIKSGCCLD